MQVKEIDINTGKIKGYGICKKKYKISFLGSPTTPTYSRCLESTDLLIYAESLHILYYLGLTSHVVVIQ